jgi:phage shock protein C
MTTNTTDIPRTPFRRRASNRILGGVCGGLSDATGIDANLLRLLVFAFAWVGGVTVALYIAAWILIPVEGEDRSIAERRFAR